MPESVGDIKQIEVADQLYNIKDAIAREMIENFFPVGSYYETSDGAFDPNETWAGTWVLENDGRVHICTSSSHEAGSTGGAETVKLNANQCGVPAHTHGFTRPSVSVTQPAFSVVSSGAHNHIASSWESKKAASGSGQPVPRAWNNPDRDGQFYTNGSGAHTHSLTRTTNVGVSLSGGSVNSNTAAAASAAHDNMMPYRTVYRWHRTA